MAPQSSAAARQRKESIAFLRELVGACKQILREGEADGGPEIDELADCTVESEVPTTSAEFEQLLSRYEWSRGLAEEAWPVLARRTTTRATSLARLLRSSFGAEGCGPFYASARNTIFKSLVNVSQEGANCPGFLWQVMGPVLLGMDTLECYSIILAQAAEQLRPAAALQLATDSQCPGAAGASGTGQPQVSAAAAGPRGEQQRPQMRYADPAKQQQGGQKRHGYWPRTPSLEDIEELVQEPIALFAILGMAVSGLRHAPADTACGRTCTGSSSSSSSSKGDDKSGGNEKSSDGDSGSDGAGGASSSSSGGGAGGGSGSSGSDGGSGGGADSPPPEAPSMLTSAAGKLQSSCVLEHWARLLLLGTSAAVARGDSTQQRKAQALQARALYALSNVSHFLGLGWEGLVHLPCGRALAATHMAYLCTALDGGGAFGLVRPAEIVLPACELCIPEHERHADPVAVSFDADLTKRGTAVSLRPAMYILRAWMWLMTVQAPAMPLASGGAGQGEGGCSAAAAPPPQQQGDGAGEQGPEEEGQAHRGQGLPGAGSCSLPPYNRSATVALCLRLAKGVLARWGEAIPGARLDTDGGDGGASSSSSGSGPQLPKVGGCAVLYDALACSRLALLQAVQGRERVPRRTREQLRAWWRTYVAAVQHPEALTVGVPEDNEEFEHDQRDEGPSVRPSADTAAALEAGVLPCLSRLVTRMGAGTKEGAVWSPPLSYPTFQVRWSEVLLHGQLGQVGEVVAATGRRVRLAVGELRAVVAAGGKAGEHKGRSVEWLAEVACNILLLAYNVVKKLGGEVLGCGQRMGGSEQQHVGAAEKQGGAGAGGVWSSTGADGEEQAPKAEEGHGAAEAGGPSRPTGADGEQQALTAVRYSYAVAELLPQISSGVQLCAELDGWEEGGGGQGHGAVGGAASEASAQLMGCISSVIPTALECANLVLAKHIRAAAEQHGAVAEAAGGGGAGSSSSSGGGGGGVGSSALAGGGSDTPWRQLLLGDVRLMGLLGAAMQLWAGLEAEYMCAKDVTQDAQDDAQQYESMRKQLSAAMVLAAVAFPAEFRAAAGGKRAAEAAAGPRAVPEAAAAAAAGKRGTGGGAGGGTGGYRHAPPCINLAEARAVMGDAGFADGVEVVDRVLGGWEPTAGEAWGLASSCLGRCGVAAEELPSMLAALVQPAEARAAVAAAAAV